MPKIYYRCSKCHSKVFFKYVFNGRYIFIICPVDGKVMMKDTYRCQHDYWWKLLYLKIRDLIKRINKDK